MIFLANENIPIASVKYLQSVGYDVTSIAINYQGISDVDVMEIAMNEGGTIITFDRDYSELIFKHGYKPPQGVIYLRLKEFTPEFPGRLIDQLLKQKEVNFDRKLTVLDEKGLRQRKY